MPITILLVDDQALVRSGVRAYLETHLDLELVAEASSGEEAVQLTAEYAPDVVLMDLIMPGMDGVEATRRVRTASPRSQIVVLTSFHEDNNIFPAIQAGAISYLLKDIGPDELADAIRAAARGEAVIHPQVAARLLQELRGNRSEMINPYKILSEREQEVLKLIAGGLSNAEIATKLVLSEKTIKSHVSNILSKLHLVDRTQAAVFAWREGVVRKAP